MDDDKPSLREGGALLARWARESTTATAASQVVSRLLIMTSQ